MIYKPAMCWHVTRDPVAISFIFTFKYANAPWISSPHRKEPLMEKIYAVQVFHEVYDGVRADEPLLYESESLARMQGETLAPNRHGVLVYQRVVGADRRDHSEPMILAKYGHVPNMQTRG
jgi:hypothetical protein